MRYFTTCFALGLGLVFVLGSSNFVSAQTQQTQPPTVVLTELEQAALKADVWQFKVLPLGRDNQDGEEVVAEGRIRLAGNAIFFNDADDIKEGEDDVRLGDYEIRREGGGTLEVRLIFKKTLQKPDYIQGVAKLTYDEKEPGGVWNGSFLPKGDSDEDGRGRKNYKFELRRTVD